jgi:hypothetical protein
VKEGGYGEGGEGDEACCGVLREGRERRKREGGGGKKRIRGRWRSAR